MNKRAILAIPIALLLSNAVQAQDWYGGVSYGMATPVSDTKDFTGGTSWRNWGVDVLAFVRPTTSVGVSFGWNIFNDVTTEVSSIEQVDIQGTQFRYINSFPILVNIREYRGARGSARPFFGLGIGTQVVKQRVDVGQWRISDSTWHFALAPEIGVVLPFESEAKWFISAKYHYAVKASDRTHSYFGFNIGIVWETDGF